MSLLLDLTGAVGKPRLCCGAFEESGGSLPEFLRKKVEGCPAPVAADLTRGIGSLLMGNLVVPAMQGAEAKDSTVIPEKNPVFRA